MMRTSHVVWLRVPAQWRDRSTHVVHVPSTSPVVLLLRPRRSRRCSAGDAHRFLRAFSRPMQGLAYHFTVFVARNQACACPSSSSRPDRALQLTERCSLLSTLALPSLRLALSRARRVAFDLFLLSLSTDQVQQTLLGIFRRNRLLALSWLQFCG